MKADMQQPKKTYHSLLMIRKFIGSGLIATILLTFAALSTAKEIGSGGTVATGATTGCSPGISLAAKGDAKIGETGLASVQFGWSVKPCNSNPDVVVVATITNFTTKEVVYLDSDAALNDKITVFVARRYAYECRISIFDAVTGELLGFNTVYASTVNKNGV